MKEDNMTIEEMRDDLMNRFHEFTSYVMQPDAPKSIETEEIDEEEIKTLKARIAKSFHYLLANTPAAEHARSILDHVGIDIEMREKLTIGYAPGDRLYLEKFLKKEGFSKAQIIATGLFDRFVDPRVANELECKLHGDIVLPVINGTVEFYKISFECVDKPEKEFEDDIPF